MRLSRHGFTLLEAIIGLAILSAVLTVGTDLLIHALRATGAGEGRGMVLDQAGGALYRLGDELRTATGLLSPSRSSLMQPGAPYLVFATADRVIGYRLVNDPRPDVEAPQFVLERTEYYPGYTDGRPATQIAVQGSARLLTTFPTQVRFSVGPENVAPPPGQGGGAPGQTPGTGGVGLALAWGTEADTVNVRLSITAPGAQPVVMSTKKTPWPALFPGP